MRRACTRLSQVGFQTWAAGLPTAENALSVRITLPVSSAGQASSTSTESTEAPTQACSTTQPSEFNHSTPHTRAPATFTHTANHQRHTVHLPTAISSLHTRLLSHLACPVDHAQAASDAAAAPTECPACWSCKAQQTSVPQFCSHCGAVQPMRGLQQGYYQLLGMTEEAFDIDLGELESRYKALQWQLHPDKVSTRSQVEQGYSDEQSAAVNQAYSILRNPLQRAYYLLHKAGVPCGEGFEGTIEDPSLLMEVMEAREAVEEAEGEELKAMSLENKARQKEIVEQISDAFRRHDLNTAAALSTKLRYVSRIGEAILAKL